MLNLEHKAKDLRRLLALKTVPRRGWTRFKQIPPEAVESVADHSYGVALLSWLLCPEHLDKARVLEMALIHDLAEVVTGDITPFDRVERSDKVQMELAALGELLSALDKPNRGVSLLKEYQDGQSAEAKFVKSMDKLDMALQSLVYERSFGADLKEFRESSSSL